MATINQHYAKDGTLSYRVRVRMKGQPLQTVSFSTLRDAQKWVKLREGEMLAGRHFPEKRQQQLQILQTIQPWLYPLDFAKSDLG